MILSNKDLLTIFTERPTKAVWDAASDDRCRYQMHLLGSGLRDFIHKVEGVEKESLHRLRQAYSKSNKDLFARLLRPVDGVFDARGGGVFYNTTDANAKKLTHMLTDVYNGYTVRQWIRNYAKPRYFDDPMGVLYMEVVSPKLNTNTAYPTYKSSGDVYEGLVRGRYFEYIIFKTAQSDVFRVVDDRYDRMVKWDGRKITELKGQGVYLNYFGYVPAFILSDIPKHGMDGVYDSPIANSIELAHEYLVDGSIRKIYKFKTGFPKEWRYPIACSTCKGARQIGGIDCPDCNGTGASLRDSPDTTWVFNQPGPETPEIGEKGGYVNPSLEYLESSKTDLQYLEDLMYQTEWGTHQLQSGERGASATATGRFIDVQPVNRRLSAYAEAFETLEKFVADHIGQINFGASFKGASIGYGRRFLIESPDELLKKYTEGRKNGLSSSALDDLYMDYLEAKFQNQQLELDREVKKFLIEPFFHLSKEEVKNLDVDGAMLSMKIYFDEWAKGVHPADWLNKKREVLVEELRAYVGNLTIRQFDNEAIASRVIARNVAQRNDEATSQ